MRILNIDLTALVPAFTALGHEVLCVGANGDSDLVVTHPRNAVSVYKQVCAAGFVPDLVFWCDSSNLPYLPGIETLPCATAFYSIDTYCHVWHFSFANAFDVVFTAQKDHLELFPFRTVPTHWLPLFAPGGEPVSGPEAFAVRDIPVAFVGTRVHPNNPDREPFLRNFKAAHPLFIYSGPYQDIFARSRIVLNQTACSELNFRCFEAMASGAGLLMEHCAHGMSELFHPGENILPLYRRNNWQEAASIAASALADPVRLAELAFAGQELVLRHHTAVNRARTVLDIMEPCIREQGFHERLATIKRRREFLAVAYAMLGQDLLGRLDQAYAEYYFNASAMLTPGTGPGNAA